jgi:curved DNA-binding protein CbpA
MDWQCFERLGLPPGSSQREIKTAFRRLARETHPDMFPDLMDKERATVAFRELYMAYEQAMEYDGESGPPQEKSEPASQPQRQAYTSSFLRQVFTDICNELDRENDKCQKTQTERLVRGVQDAWPDKKACWGHVETAMSWDINHLVNHFRSSKPDLAAFLDERYRRRNANLSATWKTKQHQEASKLEVMWAHHTKEHVKTYFMKKTRESFLVSELRDIAGYVQNQEIKDAILGWCHELLDSLEQRHKQEIQNSANSIVRVSPNKTAIKTILKRHLVSDRKTILALLPKETRAIVASVLR